MDRGYLDRESRDISTYVEYDYDTDNDCDSYGCDSICRCSTIINKKITRIDFNGLVLFFYQLLTKVDQRNKKISIILDSPNFEEVDQYCINRILSKYKVWESDSYDINVDNGYYGQEISSVELSSFDEILDHCLIVVSMGSVNDKIRYVLNLEYGFVNFESNDFVPILLDRSKIDKKSIKKNHLKSVLSEDLSHYNDDVYYLPRGIVRKVGNNYSIIDGYHRIFSTSQNDILVYQLH